MQHALCFGRAVKIVFIVGYMDNIMKALNSTFLPCLIAS